MNLVNLIFSLHKDDKAILKMAIDRKHLSAFLKYLEDFQGAFMKVKAVSFPSNFYNFDENTGKNEFMKIKTMKCVRDISSNPLKCGLRELKDFVEMNGTLEMIEADIQTLKDIGFVLEIVE